MSSERSEGYENHTRAKKTGNPEPGNPGTRNSGTEPLEPLEQLEPFGTFELALRFLRGTFE